jgi:microcystin-dependent protein
VSEPFMGEIRLVSWNYPPKGWAFCNGQLMAINQNQALFSLLGTTFGGNGQTNFALPDLRDRAPVHFGQRPGGSSFNLGQTGGEKAHTLTIAEIPVHTHLVSGSSAAGSLGSPSGNLPAVSSKPAYGTASPDVVMSPLAVGNAGGDQAHENMPPYLVLNFVIALEGIFPSQN